MGETQLISHSATFELKFSIGVEDTFSVNNVDSPYNHEYSMYKCKVQVLYNR